MRANLLWAFVLGCVSLIPTVSARADAPDTIEARVQGCATCHGTHGEGSSDGAFPRIADKPAGYLLNQLLNFREGRRSYPPMAYLLEYLHDDYLAQIARYFANERLPFAPPEATTLPATALQLGRRVVMQGDAAKGVPACIQCHGPRLSGINPGIPGLLGLSSRYISGQLEAWRVGTRNANAPDCMQSIASRLSEEEITDVAAWLSSQSAPADLAPAPAGQWTTPLPCGSEP